MNRHRSDRVYHRQWDWNEQLDADVRQLVRWAIAEDFGRGADCTSHWLVPADAAGEIAVVSRHEGVICGVRCVAPLLAEFHVDLKWHPVAADGERVEAGDVVGRLSGNLRDLLAVERTLLNFVSHLSGIASLTERYVRAVAGTGAAICDTRKTLAGWRHLAKYAVRCGGGVNHRTGLYDAVLVKDNHLAAWEAARRAEGDDGARGTVLESALARIRETAAAAEPFRPNKELVVEVEVDDLEQFRAALRARPDLILLDNFSVGQLETAVRERDRHAPHIALEASGGVALERAAAIARTGVDRISVGALTHSAPALDLGADWSDSGRGENRT